MPVLLSCGFACMQVIELEGSSTLNLGVKALLMKCPKARRLALCFSRFGLSNVVITDEGMSYIGQYGGNLDIITLTNCGGSDAGLAFVAVGCVKLRKLELRHCPFGDASKSIASNSPCGSLIRKRLTLLLFYKKIW